MHWNITPCSPVLLIGRPNTGPLHWTNLLNGCGVGVVLSYSLPLISLLLHSFFFFPLVLLNIRSCLQRWNTSLRDLAQLTFCRERLAATLYVTDRHNTADGQCAQRGFKSDLTGSTSEDNLGIFRHPFLKSSATSAFPFHTSWFMSAASVQYKCYKELVVFVVQRNDRVQSCGWAFDVSDARVADWSSCPMKNLQFSPQGSFPNLMLQKAISEWFGPGDVVGASLIRRAPQHTLWLNLSFGLTDSNKNNKTNLFIIMIIM